MGFTNVIRRAAHGLIPSAVSATRSQRYYHHQSCYTLFSISAPITPPPAVSQNHFCCSFSTAIQRRYLRKCNRLRQQTTETRRQCDDALVKVIDSEIHCAKEPDDSYKAEDVPESFPFMIEDGAGKQTVTLTRNDHGESITVEVHMPDLFASDEDASDDDDDNSETLKSELPMVVRVSKNAGPCLEFDVCAHPDEIEIKSLAIKDPEAGEDETAYEGPEFEELDENLQKAFHKYLDIRGINQSSMNFLHEYMINKDSEEYIQWLKKVKKFVEA